MQGERICEAVQMEDGGWAVMEGYAYEDGTSVTFNWMPGQKAAEYAAEQRNELED